mgnify:CR=1 FL=1
MVTYPGGVDDVFRALADPHRRELLDRLRARDGQSLGELAEALPQMTRFGVAKHLRVLADAGLVTTVRSGRRTLHHLNAVPLQEVAGRWLTPYTATVAQSLLDLRSAIENPDGSPPMSEPVIYRILIRASAEQVWSALTDTGVPRSWMWGTTIESTWQVGAPYAMSDGGTDLIVGTVRAVDRPRRLAMTFDPRWDDASTAEEPGELVYDLHDDGDGVTELTVTISGLAGSSAASAARDTPEIYSCLKSVLETGEPLR